MILQLQAVEHLFAPWKQLYSDSIALSTAVTAAHLLAMLFGGGLAIAADRTTLRLRGDSAEQRRQHLIDLNQVHRPVLIALTFSFITGVAMLTSDIATFVASPALWVKLGLVALLLINGVLLQRTETALRESKDEAGSESLWSRLKFNAISSLVLWSATLVAGITLVNVA
ncbi:MAG TPA: hypothetical protein VD758_05635 [Gemmatimonadaceae bacterium]|nr:hypothetical protein [Gemmatimonadaceae bacterium]